MGWTQRNHTESSVLSLTSYDAIATGGNVSAGITKCHTPGELWCALLGLPAIIPRVVQNAQNYSNSGSTDRVGLTFPQANKSGNFLILDIFFEWSDTGLPPRLSVTDTLGNQWVPLYSARTFFLGPHGLISYQVSGCLAGINAVTLRLLSGTMGHPCVIATEYSGVTGINALPYDFFQGSHAYSLADKIVDPAGHKQEITTAGTSHADWTFLTWNDSGGTTGSGSAVFTDRGVLGEIDTDHSIGSGPDTVTLGIDDVAYGTLLHLVGGQDFTCTPTPDQGTGGDPVITPGWLVVNEP